MRAESSDQGHSLWESQVDVNCMCAAYAVTQGGGQRSWRGGAAKGKCLICRTSAVAFSEAFAVQASWADEYFYLVQ